MCGRSSSTQLIFSSSMARLPASSRRSCGPGHLWIENVAVAPEQQGRGFGRLLLAHAERCAIHAGRLEIRLMTNQAFAANVELYARRGYSVNRAEPFRGGTTVHMSKRIEPLDAGAGAATGAGSSA
jgi:ribosomal protein S18 acetylase RimI-like enzyme